MNKEFKAIFFKLLNKWLFPDFTNKLTWAVAIAGISMITTPVEFRVAVCNWIINTFNLSSISPFQVPPLDERNSFGWYILIISALAHNLGYKYISFMLETLEFEKKREKRALDISLFESFVELLPSSGQTVQMLKDQDFSTNIRKSSLDSIDDFLHYWAGAEYCFNNQEVEKKKTVLFNEINKFRCKVAQYTVPKFNDFLTVFPRHVDPEVEIPDNIRSEIQEMNNMATDLFEMHQNFIDYCRSEI